MLIEVFRTGTHTDSSGNTRTWTEQDLDMIVKKYDPSNHEAPVVIGHPEHNAPAYGWVESLERKGRSLWAKIKPTVNEFVDWVKRGLYKKVSIALYPDLSLRHIGFLGAMPPAVKGLQPPQFSDSEFSEYTIEFRDWTADERDRLAKGQIKGDFAGPNQSFPIAGPQDVADAWRLAGRADNPDEVRRNIIRIAKKYGWTDALPETAIEWAKEHNIELKEVKMDKIIELEEKLKEKEKALAEFAEKDKAKEEEIARLKRELEEERAKQRKAEFASFCDKLISEGRLTPAMRPVVLDFMEILQGIGEYEFSEGKAQPIEKFKAFLTGLPKQVEFGEIARKNNTVVTDDITEIAKKIASVAPKGGK